MNIGHIDIALAAELGKEPLPAFDTDFAERRPIDGVSDAGFETHFVFAGENLKFRLRDEARLA